MLFNSFVFPVFLVVVLALYYALSHRWQNRMLLLASYVFYGAWDWRFLGLLCLTTVIDYYVGWGLGRLKMPSSRRRLLLVSIVANLGILAAFKYFNFFVDNMDGLLVATGLGHLSCTMRVVVPVGISFYTFQSMSYTIDVYRGTLAPARSLGEFALYVAYFPQLVAGPIERATTLLPCIRNKRTVTPDQIAGGLQLMLLGYLKKVAIADAVAPYVSEIFADPAAQTSLRLLLGLYLFAIQIYCDFSGYTDIARGVSRLMGIELMVNFRQPYFAADITDFWRRWHISLSTWLRDYLYIPLGGNRHGSIRTYRNLGLTMLLGGLWHGAAWNYVIWGGLHGVYLAAHKWWREMFPVTQEQSAVSRPSQAIARLGYIVLTFHLVCLTWLFFRAPTFASSIQYLGGLLHGGTWTCDMQTCAVAAVYMLMVLLLDAIMWAQEHGRAMAYWRSSTVRGVAYATAVIMITFIGASHAEAFIYFQF